MGRHAKQPFRMAAVCDCGDHGFVGLTRGLVAFVSPARVPEVAQWWWCAGAAGRGTTYPQTTRPGENAVRMHRFLLPNAECVDHINGDRLDNRDENLRACTHRQNMRNARSKRGTSSPFKGVTTYRGKWIASIRTDQGEIYLGTFATQEAAARAYDASAIREHGEFARTNASMGLFRASRDDRPFDLGNGFAVRITREATK